MKYKKGGPITSVDDLTGEVANEKPVFYKDELTRCCIISSLDFYTVFISIENRNFFYAVEDDE